MFEGITPRVEFTEEQWYMIRATSKYYLAVPFEGKARDMWITKMFRKPIAAIEARY